MKNTISGILLLLAFASLSCGCGGGGGREDEIVERENLRKYPEQLENRRMVFNADNQFLFARDGSFVGKRAGKDCLGTYSYQGGTLTLHYGFTFPGNTERYECTGALSGYDSATGRGTYSYAETSSGGEALTPFPTQFTLSKET
jgi:hypothetical protein